MSYHIEPQSGDIVIDTFNAGIGTDPYSGLTDLKSVNPSSIQGEASVSFATTSVSKAPAIPNNTSSSLITTSSGLFVAPSNLNMENGQYITFSNLGGAIGSGLAINTPYLLSYFALSGANYEWQLYTLANVLVGVSTASTTTVTFSTIAPSKPKFFSQASIANFMIDSSGLVWSNYILTSGAGGTPATNSWTWTGNTTGSESHGNGMVYWRTSNSTTVGDWDGWLFIFQDGQIDYSNVDGVNNGVPYHNVGTWVYGWNPATHSINQSNYLTGSNLNSCPHNAIVGPDGNVYFCDYYTMKKIEQANIITPVSFVPTTSASYLYSNSNPLPIEEIATCIAPLGINYIIGGRFNQAYIWDGISATGVVNPILLAESYVNQIVTVNVNAYIFCGNRGNIYVTNGSQASPFAKIPDHISGTVEPYIQWGDATFVKNRLVFSVFVSNNAGTPISGYGGVWMIDLTTNAMWLSNQLSYGTYAGYASALASVGSGYNPNLLPTVPVGYGLLIGWVNGSTYGIDTTISTPYTNGASCVVSDIIPVGTLLKPGTAYQFEYKLATPLLSGESVQLLVGSSLSDYAGNTMTNVFTSTGDGKIISDNSSNHGGSPIQNQQWLLVQAILTGIASNSSYNRIVQLRVIGDTLKTSVPTQPYALG